MDCVDNEWLGRLACGAGVVVVGGRVKRCNVCEACHPVLIFHVLPSLQ